MFHNFDGLPISQNLDSVCLEIVHDLLTNISNQNQFDLYPLRSSYKSYMSIRNIL